MQLYIITIATQTIYQDKIENIENKKGFLHFKSLYDFYEKELIDGLSELSKTKSGSEQLRTMFIKPIEQIAQTKHSFFSKKMHNTFDLIVKEKKLLNKLIQKSEIHQDNFLTLNSKKKNDNNIQEQNVNNIQEQNDRKIHGVESKIIILQNTLNSHMFNIRQENKILDECEKFYQIQNEEMAQNIFKKIFKNSEFKEIKNFIKNLNGIDNCYFKIQNSLNQLENVIVSSNHENINLLDSIIEREQKKNQKQTIIKTQKEQQIARTEDILLNKEFLQKIQFVDEKNEKLNQELKSKKEQADTILTDMNNMSTYFLLKLQARYYKQEISQYLEQICILNNSDLNTISFDYLNKLVENLSDTEYYQIANNIPESFSIDCFLELYNQYKINIQHQKSIEFINKDRLININKNPCCKSYSEGNIEITQEAKSKILHKSVSLLPTDNCIHHQNKQLINFLKAEKLNKHAQVVKIEAEKIFNQIKVFQNPTSKHSFEILNFNEMHKRLEQVKKEINNIKAKHSKLSILVQDSSQEKLSIQDQPSCIQAFQSLNFDKKN